MKLAALHYKTQNEPIWHVQLALVVAIVLQLLLSNQLTVGPKYVIAGFEVLLVVALALVRPDEKSITFRVRHTMSIVLIAVISFANISSLVLVIANLLGGNHGVTGKQLIISGLSIYLTNIIIFGLWYWELDVANDKPTDFLFPQMTAGESVTKQKHWSSTFLDYLYTSVTNATAFSPTDTMPLTHRAKLLMTIQSLTALLTIALVAARAVNILT